MNITELVDAFVDKVNTSPREIGDHTKTPSDSNRPLSTNWVSS
jgi:hypothetical protein